MKILNTFLSLGCLGGLVSCYPVVNPNPVAPTKINKNTVALNTPATDVVNDLDATTQSAEDMLNGTIPSADDAVSDIVKTQIPPTPPVPTGVKTASKVPGKDGFVFNPYTHNQVDVRGIPSGTKVRDPHDTNPSHVFRVP